MASYEGASSAADVEEFWWDGLSRGQKKVLIRDLSVEGLREISMRSTDAAEHVLRYLLKGQGLSSLRDGPRRTIRIPIVDEGVAKNLGRVMAGILIGRFGYKRKVVVMEETLDLFSYGPSCKSVSFFLDGICSILMHAEELRACGRVFFIKARIEEFVGKALRFPPGHVPSMEMTARFRYARYRPNNIEAEFRLFAATLIEMERRFVAYAFYIIYGPTDADQTYVDWWAFLQAPDDNKKIGLVCMASMLNMLHQQGLPLEIIISIMEKMIKFPSTWNVDSAAFLVLNCSKDINEGFLAHAMEQNASSSDFLHDLLSAIRQKDPTLYESAQKLVQNAD